METICMKCQRLFAGKSQKKKKRIKKPAEIFNQHAKG